MKHLFAVLLCIPGLALADSFTLLQRVLPPPARVVCASTGFSADGQSITGKCVQSVPAVGRYVQPARYTYDVTWDLTGQLTTAAVTCVSPAHMGIDHSGCPSFVYYADTNVVVVIDGVPYWLAGVDSLGDEPLNTQTDTYLWRP